jgi:hypothetical protein
VQANTTAAASPACREFGVLSCGMKPDAVLAKKLHALQGRIELLEETPNEDHQGCRTIE